MTPNHSWIQTATGRQFYPLAPRPADIDIADIASALSKLCRFGGHCIRFYSVAEHSVHVATAAPDEYKLTALLHDASEGLALVDIPSPVKPHLTNYYALEDGVMRAVAEKFGIMWPLPAEVKRIDSAILADERAQVMAPTRYSNADWGAIEPGLGIEIHGWMPDKAEYEFLAAYARYC